MSPSRPQQRLRGLTADGARRLLARVDPAGPAADDPVDPPGAPVHAGERAPRVLAVERGSATAVLRARLTPAVVDGVEGRIAAHPDLQALYDKVLPIDRDRLLLSLGIYLYVAEVAECTGLPTVQPPEGVHAMARGPLAAAGALYEADLVADALASAGVEIATKRSALDFGCSSGRVVRVLASAYPETSWHGCDPNAAAIAWARESIPAARFFRSGDRPPLELSDGALDLVYAISIWSHFAPDLGLRWLEEMRRLIRPGGHLVMTTHGTTTVEHDGARELRQPEQLASIHEALGRGGTWYAAEFGETGDWGVVNQEWGTAFLSPEWLLAHLSPRWRLLEFAPGRNQDNQDVYVLERV
jgi:SAM-dependent methyltransferase